MTDLVKIGFFSTAVKAEKWPPFPCLKRRGPIETYHQTSSQADSAPLSPWLKGRGSIETMPRAKRTNVDAVSCSKVATAENIKKIEAKGET